MYIVAVTRWGPGRDAQLAELAADLGVFPYDLRMRLNGPIPVIVARMRERETAAALMNKLRGWGHGAVACEDQQVVAAEAMFQVREFRFEGERLEIESVGHQPAVIESREVLMLIHAMWKVEERQTQETTKTQFSAARAVISGGLVTSITTTTLTHSSDAASEERIYLFRKTFSDPLMFAQHQLHFGGLKEAKSRSSHDNFAELTRQLRAFAPTACYDDRLRTSRRKSTLDAATTTQSGGNTTSTVVYSNASGLDVAAHLLLIAHARGQL